MSATARTPITIAQLSVRAGDPEANTDQLAAVLKHGGHDRGLVVLPECYLTGYMATSREQAMSWAIADDDPSHVRMHQLCAEHGIHLVVGFLERSGEDLFNTAALIGPDGEIGRYHKTHVLRLGADRYVTRGGPQQRVWDTPLGRVGLMICYDLRFPESARELALNGADVIAMPTNWPDTAAVLPDLVAPVRALENGVFLAVANRPDREDGTGFLGRSRIISPAGEVLVDVGPDEAVRTVSVELGVSREKLRVIRPGEYEFDVFGDRRPELYGALSRPVHDHIDTQRTIGGGHDV